MPLDMDSTALARRLDRLRSAPGRVVAGPRPRVDHAAGLASELGGLSRDGVAVFEARFSMGVNRRSLSGLSGGVPIDTPLICLDLETTGLATAVGGCAFLIGIGLWHDDSLTVRQLLLADAFAELSLPGFSN